MTGGLRRLDRSRKNRGEWLTIRAIDKHIITSLRFPTASLSSTEPHDGFERAGGALPAGVICLGYYENLRSSPESTRYCSSVELAMKH
jgi:hypothetical protein